MTRSPARETPAEIAARIVREGLDHAESKPDGWAAAMLVALDLKAKSYAHRWLTGEQQIPLRAVVASAETHPEVVEHVARRLASLVGKVLADAPRVSDVLNDFHAFASLGASSGRVLDEIGRAIADGVITPGERASMRTALRSLIEAAASYDERLAAMDREPVEGARGMRVAGGTRR